MSDDVWSSLRQQMPVARRWAYLDHAAVAPLPEPARAAIADWAQQAAEQGDVAWPAWAEAVEHTRSHAAAILGADRREIALVPNTTSALGLIAEGFPWRDGDNVVTLANEFPSNVYPWLHLANRGVACRRVDVKNGRVDLGQLLAACDRDTRLVSLSWVGYASGWRIDVAEFASELHRRDILLCLDAIQGVGAYALDVKQTDVDFLAADGHKWMLGPEGCGVLYIKQSCLDRLRPLGIGWNSVQRRFQFDSVAFELRDEAARFEGGSANNAGAIGLGASLAVLRSCGLTPTASPLADRIRSLVRTAADGLSERGAEWLFERNDHLPTGILTFRWPGHDPATVRQACLREGVVLSCRGGGIRISIHAYNNQADLEQLFESLPPLT